MKVEAPDQLDAAKAAASVGDPLGTQAVLSEVVKKLSSQALLFGLAVIVVLVGAWYLFGTDGLPIVACVLLVFFAALIGYLFVEERRKSTADALAWVGRAEHGKAAGKSAERPPGQPPGQFAPLAVELWTAPARQTTAASRDIAVVGSTAASYRIGNAITVGFRASRDCYVTLINLGTSGDLTILFPNAYQPDNFVRGGDLHHIPADGSGVEFILQGPAGVERVKAIATLQKVPLLESNFTPDGAFFDTRPAGAAPRDIAVVQRRVERLEPASWAEATAQFTVSA